MLLHRRLFLLVALAGTINIFTTSCVFPMQQAAQPPQHQEKNTDCVFKNEGTLENRVDQLSQAINNSVHRVNESMALAYSANGVSIGAFKKAKRVLTRIREVGTGLEQTIARHTQLEQQVRATTENLENEFNRVVENAHKNENNRNLSERIQIEQAGIKEMNQLGVFEQNEKIRAQASVDVEKIKWNNIQEMIADPKNIAKIVFASMVIALGVYAAKYYIPVLIDCVRRPRVISETSEKWWFEEQYSPQAMAIDDLIFTPSLKKQLFDLTYRVQSAKIYGETLPNVLFYGASGTGKTAFAKALAYCSDLDYALTSGSEFAKITDLNSANNELRKLLKWAQKSDRGLLVYIDEAESLFANRKLPTTPKIAVDFINTFLTLISDRSQKNFMFIFATNHPFKLDDAMLDRIGIHVEFTLPDATERAEILMMYLKKFAQENKQALVDICPEVIQALPLYAESLKGFSPRAIKFVAEEMVVKGRRHKFRQLTHDSASTALEEAKGSLQKTTQWKQEHSQLVTC